MNWEENEKKKVAACKVKVKASTATSVTSAATAATTTAVMAVVAVGVEGHPFILQCLRFCYEKWPEKNLPLCGISPNFRLSKDSLVLLL